MTTSTRHSTFAFICAATVFASPTSANEATNSDAEDCITSSGKKCLSTKEIVESLDFGLPENPLFTLMNSTPETIITPKASAASALSLIPYVADAAGSDPVSLGFSLNPGIFILDERYEAGDLFTESGAKTATNILTRFSLLGSLIRETEDQAFTQFGLGLSYTYDLKSPMNNFADFGSCLAKHFSIKELGEIKLKSNAATDTALAGAFPGFESRVKVKKEIDKKVNTETGEVKKSDIVKILKKEKPQITNDEANTIASDILEARKVNFVGGKYIHALIVESVASCTNKLEKWNRPAFSIGAAGYYTDGIDIDASEGYGIWTSYAFPLGEDGRVTLSAQHFDQHVRNSILKDVEGTETVDGVRAGARYTYQLSEDRNTKGKLQKFSRFFAEVGYSEEEFSGIDDTYWQAGVGAEYQLSEDVFFRFLYGKTDGSEVDRTDYLSGQFNWSFSKSAAK